MITAHDLALWSPERRHAFYAALSNDEARALEFDWRFWARPAQLPPGSLGAVAPVTWKGVPVYDPWSVWAIIAGRGFGKTRTGAEFAIDKARAMPGSHGALVGATADDVRKTMLSSGLEHMDEASGILKISPPDFRPEYAPSLRTLTWPNGTVATLYSAEEPDRLRGPQHHWGWVDEVAAWAKNLEAWNQLLYGMRLGDTPQICLTTTPRAVAILKELLNAVGTVVSRGRTRDNAANLSPIFLQQIEAKFAGTRMGRQELEGELLEDVQGALWQWAMWERAGARYPAGHTFDELERTVVAVDPSGGDGPDNDEQGIVIVAKLPGRDVRCAVLEDRSCKLSPDGWGRRVVQAYLDYEADRVVYEANYGGQMVEQTIQTAARDMNAGHIPTRAVTAMKGKQVRAEPVSALYEQNRVAHVGVLPELEAELCTWVPNSGSRSPNRLDALVYGITDLALGGATPGFKRRESSANVRRV